MNQSLYSKKSLHKKSLYKKSLSGSTLFRCLLSTLLLGLAAHAAGMFGGISYHDDVVCTYDVGATHIFGRFFLALLGKLTRLPFGGSNYSLPWFNGLISILLIGLSAWVMARALHLTSRLLQLLLCGILVVFPVITGTFAYWFTAPYYMLALFLACTCAVLLTDSLSVFSIIRNESSGISAGFFLTKQQTATDSGKSNGFLQRFLTLCAGIVLAALMTGIYQAYLPVMLALEVVILLQKEQDERGSWRSWLRPLSGTTCSVALYLVLMKLSLAMTGKEIYAYRGMDTLGAGNFGYPERILMAYRMFFDPGSFLTYRGSDDYLLFMWSMKPVYFVLIILILCMSGVILLRVLRKEKTNCEPSQNPAEQAVPDPQNFKSHRISRFLRMCILFLLFPLTANFIFVMTDYDVYDLMLYGELMIFVLALWLSQQLLLQVPATDSNIRPEGTESSSLSATRCTLPGRSLLSGISCLLVLYSILFYIRYDNLCYYKAGRMQEAAISYDNVLIMKIQMLDGYDPSLPVCFLNEFEKDTSFLAADTELDKVRITPYDGSEIINDYSWVNFMKVHCGYAPQVIEDYGQYDSYVSKNNMPHYPAADSIQIVDGVIVINF